LEVTLLEALLVLNFESPVLDMLLEGVLELDREVKREALLDLGVSLKETLLL